MPRTSEWIRDSTGNVKPYVERALQDEELRESLRRAFDTARSIYDEMTADRGFVTQAGRVATNRDIQADLRRTILDLRAAADRVQGKNDHGGRNAFFLMLGIVLGILFNPVTGPSTRKWVGDKVLGSGGDFTYESSNGGTGAPAT
jgi:hypothetical protein